MSLTIPIHTLEAIATGAGLINTYLAARANIWNWLFGMITVILFAIIFLSAGLYAGMGIQIIFLMLQFYGLYHWRYGGKQHETLAITHASRQAWGIACLLFIASFASLIYLLQHHTNSTMVYMDALTSALSLVAQWMMSQKWIENWLLWVVMDVISIDMYIEKHLIMTAILYFLLFVLSVKGYAIWKKHITFHYDH